MLILLPHKASGILTWDEGFFLQDLLPVLRWDWLLRICRDESDSILNLTQSSTAIALYENENRAGSSVKHKQGKGWAMQWNKGFPF